MGKDAAVRAHDGGVADHAHIGFEENGIPCGVEYLELEVGVATHAEGRVRFPDELEAVIEAVDGGHGRGSGDG